jgi:hypothetical protein
VIAGTPDTGMVAARRSIRSRTDVALSRGASMANVLLEKQVFVGFCVLARSFRRWYTPFVESAHLPDNHGGGDGRTGKCLISNGLSGGTV